MKSKGILVSVAILFVLISGIIYITREPETGQVEYKFEAVEEINNVTSASVEDASKKVSESLEISSSKGSQQIEESLDEKIIIYIHGAVHKEGVYEVEPGDRVYKALELAGGMTQEASSGHVNLARFLEDGESIYFPTHDEEIELVQKEEKEEDDRIDINTATKDQLISLPGIGDTKAQSVIAYRKLNGEFSTIEQIMNVSGIKESLFESIKSLIRI